MDLYSDFGDLRFIRTIKLKQVSVTWRQLHLIPKPIK